MLPFSSQYFVLKTSSLVLSRKNFQEKNKYFLLQWLEKDYRIAVSTVACITDFCGWFSSHLLLLSWFWLCQLNMGDVHAQYWWHYWTQMNQCDLLFYVKLFNSRHSQFIHSNPIVCWNRGIHSINACRGQN